MRVAWPGFREVPAGWPQVFHGPSDRSGPQKRIVNIVKTVVVLVLIVVSVFHAYLGVRVSKHGALPSEDGQTL